MLSKARRASRVGLRGIAQRVALRSYQLTGAAELRFNLDYRDILTDIPADLPVPSSRLDTGRAASIGWVMTPPAPGSGGHTTLFRMVEALENAGHRCVVFIYDKHGLDVTHMTARIRAHWPNIQSEIRDARSGLSGVDAVVATSWESAHVVVKYGSSPMRRLYFIQDYEPYFYGHGAEYELAAMTYQLPFIRIVLGEMLDGMVLEATGLRSQVVPFGCDASVYAPPSPEARRSGIVFYSRPDFSRRGYEIACVALTKFHQMHPDEDIHVYGSYPRGLTAPFEFHGRLTALELNSLYGRTIAGLAMSFTNITLVAEEMLAAGNIPVVNDMALAHLVLPNPFVKWAEPTAGALAQALSDVVSLPDVSGRASAAAESVVGRSWGPTQSAVVGIIEEAVYGVGNTPIDRSRKIGIWSEATRQ